MRHPIALCLIVVLFVTVSWSRPAHAVCEPPGAAAGAAAAVAASTVALTNQKLAYFTVAPGIFNIYAGLQAQQPLLADLQTMDMALQSKMQWMWDEWLRALQLSTAQLVAASTDKSRTMVSMFDSQAQQKTARTLQKAEIEAQKDYAITDEGCRFDSVAKYKTRADQVSEAVAGGLSQDVNTIANADKNSKAARGQAAYNQNRWAFYAQKTCDTQSNAGQAGCTAANTALTNAHITPGRTLFAKETIDMQNSDKRRAVEEMTVNLTGMKPLPSIAPDALKTPQGQEQRLENRSYLAQQDAVSSLVTSIVGERTPIGTTAQEVAELRARAGVTGLAAPYQPSENEIHQAMVEKLWDPAYYVTLKSASSSEVPGAESAMLSSPNAILQKEIQLQAFNVAMLFNMIEKMERIGNVYTVQTANMLKKKKPQNFPPFEHVAAKE